MICIGRQRHHYRQGYVAHGRQGVASPKGAQKYRCHRTCCHYAKAVTDEQKARVNAKPVPAKPNTISRAARLSSLRIRIVPGGSNVKGTKITIRHDNDSIKSKRCRNGVKAVNVKMMIICWEVSTTTENRLSRMGHTGGLFVLNGRR